MATISDFQSKLDKVTASIAEVETTVKSLRDSISAGLSEDDQQNILNQLDTIDIRLQGIVTPLPSETPVEN